MSGYGPGAAHMLGDYVFQSDWMAQEKPGSHLPAAAHALSYTLAFLPLTRSPARLALIAGSHFVIDRWRLARHVVWAKNQLAPARHRYPWSHGSATGYHDPVVTRDQERDHEQTGCRVDALSTKPSWMTVWLMIAADNALHAVCNAVALSRR